MPYNSQPVVNSENKLLLIMTGFSCNNNCILCSLKDQVGIHQDKTTEEIKIILKSSIKEFSSVEFTGGDPTIRKDLYDLISYAKKIGFKKIAISTNARILSYEKYIDQLIEAGLTRITSTLYSHLARTHNAITRTPESFEQTVFAINNLIKKSDLELSVNTVLCQLNYRSLNDMGIFLKNIGVKNWGILDLIPDGIANQFYTKLAVKINDLSLSLNKLEEIIDDFNTVSFFDFASCLFNDNLRDSPRTFFFDAHMRKESFEQTGYSPKRFDITKGDIYNDVHKRRIYLCDNCDFIKNCAGFWIEYLDLYDQLDIENFIKINKFSK